MPSETYRHRQIGWPLILILAATLLFVGAVVAQAEAYAALVVVGVVVVTVLLLFASLTVTVDATHVHLRFGAGVIRKHFSLANIRSCRVVRNAWYHGTGIRMISGGWLYNVAGRMAVELERNDGSLVRIGTDEPERLLAAIQQGAALSPAGGESEALADSGGYWPALLIAPVIIAVAGILYMGTRPPRIVVGAETLTVRGGFHTSTTPMSAITEVVVADSLPRVRARTNGFAFAGALRGRFRLDSLGTGMLFLDRGHPPYVIVRTATSYVIIGYKDYEHTRKLIEALAKASAP